MIISIKNNIFFPKGIRHSSALQNRCCWRYCSNNSWRCYRRLRYRHLFVCNVWECWVSCDLWLQHGSTQYVLVYCLFLSCGFLFLFFTVYVDVSRTCATAAFSFGSAAVSRQYDIKVKNCHHDRVHMVANCSVGSYFR